MTRFIQFLAAVILSGFSLTALAQPANDDCANAIQLNNLSNFCSATGAYTNVGASESGVASPFCFPTNQANLDVWFTFVAQAPRINISVAGNTPFNPGGTMENPQFALYDGNCGNLNEVECKSDAFDENYAESFAGPLVVGQRYWIRVSARQGATGTFQLCINNFNEIPDPSGDCASAVILCDKSPFTVEKVSGEGSDIDGFGFIPCEDIPNGCVFDERSSTWYKWTCKDPGTLTFSLTPLNPVDDIDFVLFELPNGINNCSEKQVLRCNFSGENVGSPIGEWIACTGPTGLIQGDGDDGELCGCQPGDNNFSESITMEAGKSYGIVINNFSQSGAGFSVEFGGTGTFLGPEADFNTDADTVCYGDPITFTDASFFPNGNIVRYNWNFGVNANPPIRTGKGPHQVSWSDPGTKSIILQIESDEGCIVTTIKTIVVEPCCKDENAITASGVVSDLLCAGIPQGAVDLSVSSNAPPHTFLWTNGSTNEDISNLQAGNYTVTITNEATCTDTLSFDVNSPPPVEIDTLIDMPTCDGGRDGRITLNVSGGTPPYVFDWNDGNGFVSRNFLDTLPIGFYDVRVRDDNGCEEELTIEVRELELVLDPAAQAVFEPSCFGFSDGSLVISVANGLGPYLYNFNDGRGYVGSNKKDDIAAGTYIVDVLDANNCMGQFMITVGQPDSLQLELDAFDISCFGDDDGSGIAHVTGGVGGYSYNWTSGSTDSVAAGLPPGNFSVLVTDANGCEIGGGITIVEPPKLLIDSTRVVDVLCFGDQTGNVELFASGGVPPYLYSSDGSLFQTSLVLDSLPAGSYSVFVQDANGCEVSAPVFITEPPPLIIDAGPDQTVELGFGTRINTVLSPLGLPVAYSWSPVDYLSCESCPDPDVLPPNTTQYIVTVVDENGCVAEDSVTIFVEKIRPVYVPNAFSPNGDGNNDFFTIFGGPGASQILVLRIYNRWGNMVFQSRNMPLNEPLLGWDGSFKGKLLPPDVFAYYAEVQFIDKEVVLVKGSVNIVR